AGGYDSSYSDNYDEPDHPLEEPDTTTSADPANRNWENEETLSNLAYPADKEPTESSGPFQAQASSPDSIDPYEAVTETLEPTFNRLNQQDSLEYCETEVYSEDETASAFYQEDFPNPGQDSASNPSHHSATSYNQVYPEAIPKSQDEVDEIATTVNFNWEATEEEYFGPQEPLTINDHSDESTNTRNNSEYSPTEEGSNLPQENSEETWSSTNVPQPVPLNSNNANSSQVNLHAAMYDATSELQPTPHVAQDRLKQTQNSRVVQSIQSALNRRVQYSLQQKLLEVYNYQCAITRCPIRPLLETTLITGSDRAILDHPSNGLVLRSDLRTLYDLHLLAIHPNKLTILLAPTLLKTDYASLKGRKIAVPAEQACQPNPGFLKHHLLACKWYSEAEAAAAQAADGEGLLPFIPHPRRGHGLSQHPQKLVIGLGAAIVCTALAGIFWFSGDKKPHLQVPTLTSDNQSQEAPTNSENAINLRIGPVVHQHNGLILENSAYLPTDLAGKLGINSTDIPAEATKEYQGSSYFKASYLKTLDIGVNWDAENRTLALDCCKDLEIQPIDLRVNDKEAASGIIVDHSAYIPATTLEQLKLDKSQISESNFLEYDHLLYLKVASLRELSVQSQWNADTRTLSLSK
ncbi:MAG TPA: HNH endonuclease signature motif containing protein, partial [Leptolyngbyaceae cyanobacterium]